jgi:hypothetical protein
MRCKKVLSPEDEDFGFTKIAYRSDKTNLPYDLWCDCLGKYRKKGVRPFVMLPTNEYKDWLYISIEQRPCVLKGDKEKFPKYEIVMDYVRDNYKIFLKHWKCKIDDIELGWELKIYPRTLS